MFHTREIVWQEETNSTTILLFVVALVQQLCCEAINKSVKQLQNNTQYTIAKSYSIAQQLTRNAQLHNNTQYRTILNAQQLAIHNCLRLSIAPLPVLLRLLFAIYILIRHQATNELNLYPRSMQRLFRSCYVKRELQRKLQFSHVKHHSPLLWANLKPQLRKESFTPFSVGNYEQVGSLKEKVYVFRNLLFSWKQSNVPCSVFLLSLFLYLL